MSKPAPKNSYSPIEKHNDFDLENDSDDTLTSTFLGKNGSSGKGKRAQARRTQTVLTWIRWSVIVVMQSTIVWLLLKSGKRMDGRWTQADTETGGDVNGLYVPKSHKYEHLSFEKSKFVPNLTTDENRMEVRHNWDMLMPLGSGSVLIPDYEKYPQLGLPIDDDPIHTGPIFEASWTHALHCLYYTVDSYHQLVLSTPATGLKFGFDGTRNDAHAVHCFEYLRTQLLCMADMTLEGAPSVLGAEGQGQAHMCRNRDEAIEWIEARRVDDIQSIVGP